MSNTQTKEPTYEQRMGFDVTKKATAEKLVSIELAHLRDPAQYVVEAMKDENKPLNIKLVKAWVRDQLTAITQIEAEGLDAQEHRKLLKEFIAKLPPSMMPPGGVAYASEKK